MEQKPTLAVKRELVQKSRKKQQMDEGTKSWCRYKFDPSLSPCCFPVISMGILQMSSQRVQHINFIVNEQLVSVIRGMIVWNDIHYTLVDTGECKTVVRKPWSHYDRLTLMFCCIEQAAPHVTFGCGDPLNQFTVDKTGCCCIWRPPVWCSAR